MAKEAMKTRNKILNLGLLFVLTFAIGISSIAISSERTYAAETNTAWLQISPAALHVTLEPGQIYDGTYEVWNVGDKDANFRIYVNALKMKDESYTPLYSEDNTGVPRSEIARWVSFDQTEYSLKAGDHVNISYRISVPENAPGGGQVAAIMTEPIVDKIEGSGVQAVPRIALPFYTTIGGNTDPSGKLIEQRIPWFYTQGPIKASSLVENNGNVDFLVKYKMTVKTLSGKDAMKPVEQERIILPDQGFGLRNTLEWNDGPALGIFKVTQEVEFLGHSYSLTKTVVIIPLFLVVIIIIALVLALVAIVSNAKRRHDGSKKRSYHKRGHSR